MSDATGLPEEDDLLAAEHALGLLDAAENALAERRSREEPAFAASVEAWRKRMEPLLGAVPAREPPAHVWAAISTAIAPAAVEQAGNVVQLKKRVAVWRGYSAAITAIAASLALVVGLDMLKQSPPVPVVQPSASEPMLVATVAPESGPVSIMAAYDSGSGDLIVTPAGLSAVAGHDHELWVVPGTGNPRSLGLIRAGAPERITLPAEMATMLHAEATLAISAEPTGGSPTGLPTGPIVATGKLSQV